MSCGKILNQAILGFPGASLGSSFLRQHDRLSNRHLRASAPGGRLIRCVNKYTDVCVYLRVYIPYIYICTHGAAAEEGNYSKMHTEICIYVYTHTDMYTHK